MSGAAAAVNVELAVHALQDLGCTVMGPVGTCGGALRRLERGEPLDLALLDVNLGGENAYEIADALSARAAPFVFVSGYGASGLEPRYASGCVLTRSSQPAVLARVIGEVLAGSAERRP